MRSYMEGKKYRENKGESAIMEKMKKYIKFARGKIFFSFYHLFSIYYNKKRDGNRPPVVYVRFLTNLSSLLSDQKQG